MFTPLQQPISTHYPIPNPSRLSPLVRERIQCVYRHLYDVIGAYGPTRDLRLFLTGSQVHGRSKSEGGRQADIDLFLICPTLETLSVPLRQSLINRVKRRVGFRVDISHTNQDRFDRWTFFVNPDSQP